MALGAFRIMQRNNRIREFAYHFFSELGCLSPEKSISFIQLIALGLGVTDAGLKYLLKNGVVEIQDGTLYFDIDKARRKIITSIVFTWVVFITVIVALYITYRSPGLYLMYSSITVLLILAGFMMSAYTALPLRIIKKKELLQSG